MARRASRAVKPGIFISYRREDASGFAGRLHGSLSAHFGRGRVFRDIDTIAPGVNFAEHIDASLKDCRAFVVVIGREWLVDIRGRRRLEDPQDWVRLEVVAALEREDVFVVPVLVENATMPSADDLPAPLAPLTQLNALEVSDSRWDYDVSRLTNSLEQAVGPPAAPWTATLRRLLVPTGSVGAAGRILAAAAVVFAAVVAVQTLDRPPSPAAGGAPMTGDYNIAVAQFESVDAGGGRAESVEAAALAGSVHDVLRQELSALGDQGFDVKLRPPVETGPVRGATSEERARAAEALAGRIRADVVVYGVLRAEVPSQFSAEFYVSDRLLHHAEELSGQHDLGSPIATAGDIGRNPVARKDLRDQILVRARALAEFVVGLSYYGADQHQAALSHFEAARATTGWDDRDGKEVLYLFLGHTAGKLNDLDRADAFYDAALALDPEYARAQLGRAEVLLQRSRGTCEQGTVDVGGMNTALEGYRRARSARVQPPASDIPTKVIFSEGRVHLCLSQALAGNYWAEAEREFGHVIAEFERGNGRIRELAAESHANLGFVHLPAAGDPDAATRYRRAADDYHRAIDLTVDNERKAFFASMRGFIFGRLQEPVIADEAYAMAIRLSQDPGARARYEQARRSLAT